MLLDTTVLRDTYPEGIVCSAKTLSLFTVCLEENIFEERINSAVPDCIIEEGINPGEKIVKFPFSADTELPEAYEKITRLWKKAFPCGEEKILFIAQDFDYSCSAKNEESAPCVWAGTDFANPLTAFWEGMNLLINITGS